MGNRRKSAIERNAQSYRNLGNRMSRVSFGPRYRADGEIRRGEGTQNYPYGPARPGTHPSLLSVLAHGARLRKTYQSPNGLNREELRALCKKRKVRGWGKMTTAQMREALR